MGKNSVKHKLNFRKDNEQPFEVAIKEMRYHHMGIPVLEPRPGEKYIKKLKMYVSGFESSE